MSRRMYIICSKILLLLGKHNLIIYLIKALIETYVIIIQIGYQSIENNFVEN